MKLQPIATENAPAAIGPYSQAIRFGNMLFCSGQIPLDPLSGEVVTGDPVQELAKAASRLQADLIVVGHKHLDGWAARWWRGSVSKHLIEHAPCSVLVVITR